MIYTMTARVWLMVNDHKVSICHAVDWVTRRLPKGLRRYYGLKIMYTLNSANH